MKSDWFCKDTGKTLPAVLYLTTFENQEHEPRHSIEPMSSFTDMNLSEYSMYETSQPYRGRQNVEGCVLVDGSGVPEIDSLRTVQSPTVHNSK